MSELLHDGLLAACTAPGADGCWHVRSTLGRLHGQIQAYGTSAHKHQISTTSYDTYMEEGEQ